MSSVLSSNALVCYASPAFHTQAALYEHTKNQSIVSASTFPPVNKLVGHGAWYYDKGGLLGIANPDFVRIELEPLESRIGAIVAQKREQGLNAGTTLKELAETLIQAMSDNPAPSAMDTWFQQQLQRVEYTLEAMRAVGVRDEARLESILHFGQVRAFCNAYRLDWYVLGSGA